MALAAVTMSLCLCASVVHYCRSNVVLDYFTTAC